MSNKKIVVILGIGRSGTSFITSWLKACGLNVGDNLVPPDKIANPLGFFEDIDFAKFSEKIPYQRSTLYDKIVTIDPVFDITDTIIDRAAQLLINKNMSNQQWGWKYPRTTNLWHNLWLPAFKKANIEPSQLLIIYVYRDYRSYLNSAIRSSELHQNTFLKKTFFRMMIDKFIQKYFAEWMRLNNEMYDYLLGQTDLQYLILNHQAILENSNSIYNYLTEKGGLTLQYVNPSTIFKHELYNRLPHQFTIDFSKLDTNAADGLMAKLNGFSNDEINL